MKKTCLLLVISLLILGGCSEPYNPFKIEKEEFFNKVKTVGITPLIVQVEIDDVEERKKEFMTGGIVTILFWSIGFLVPSMLLMGMGLKPFLLESYCAQVLLVICILIPTTPGSSGVAEASTAFLYAPLINQSLLGVFILLFRFITYHLNLLVGGLFLYKIFK